MEEIVIPPWKPSKTAPGWYKWIMYTERAGVPGAAVLELDRVDCLEEAEIIFEQCLEAYEGIDLVARLYPYTDGDWDLAVEFREHQKAFTHPWVRELRMGPEGDVQVR